MIADAENYVDGVNAYISMAEANPINERCTCPGEYAGDRATGRRRRHSRSHNVISIASLIGGQLGQGGGGQLPTAILYENLEKRFGAERNPIAGVPAAVAARPKSRAARAPAPTCPALARSSASPIPTTPTPRRRSTEDARSPTRRCCPPRSSLVKRRVAGSRARCISQRRVSQSGSSSRARASGRGLLGGFPRSDSNALLVSGRYTTTGHPIAVIGPQVGYWSPEILMEEDIHGPGIDADGASFPGTNIYVELGHGTDYAWSATSEGQNIIDTFAVPLCNPAGGAVAPDSDYYLLGRPVRRDAGADRDGVVAAERRRLDPGGLDHASDASHRLRTRRRPRDDPRQAGRLHQPALDLYARARLRDGVPGIQRACADAHPAGVHARRRTRSATRSTGSSSTASTSRTSPRERTRSAQPGPTRCSRLGPRTPGRDITRAPTPRRATRPRACPRVAHPHVIDQHFITSWNNKPAHGYDYVDGEYSSIYRSQLLDNNIQHYLDGGGHKLTLVDLINAMGNAGTQDLRGVDVLPYALQARSATPSNPALAQAVAELRAWVASGAHRINRANPSASGQYDQSAAVRIMDAWWPLLVKAEFEPVLGSTLFADVKDQFSFDNTPQSHLGSAWDTGFYGIVQEDLARPSGSTSPGH